MFLELKDISWKPAVPGAPSLQDLERNTSNTCTIWQSFHNIGKQKNVDRYGTPGKFHPRYKKHIFLTLRCSRQ